MCCRRASTLRAGDARHAVPDRRGRVGAAVERPDAGRRRDADRAVSPRARRCLAFDDERPRTPALERRGPLSGPRSRRARPSPRRAAPRSPTRSPPPAISATRAARGDRRAGRRGRDQLRRLRRPARHRRRVAALSPARLNRADASGRWFARPRTRERRRTIRTIGLPSKRWPGRCCAATAWCSAGC